MYPPGIKATSAVIIRTVNLLPASPQDGRRGQAIVKSSLIQPRSVSLFRQTCFVKVSTYIYISYTVDPHNLGGHCLSPP